MTVSILDTMATLPSGQRGQRLSVDQLGRHLRDYYFTETEKQREARHHLRDELYQDGGIAAMSSLIDLMFSDPTVRELRKRWVPVSRFNNAIKRIANEQSTVYSEPALRRVEGEDNNRRYREVQERCDQAEVFIRLNRMLNLHRSVLVGFRVRETPSGSREPVIDIATPSNVRAVLHPNDSTQVIAWLIRVSHRNVHTTATDRAPSWVLESDHERVNLNDHGEILGEPVEHELGCNRWVPITRGPAVPGFWPGDEGEDLVAGHLAIWFTEICGMKETKSATNQTILSGDLSSMARGQAMDTETPVEAPEGVGVSTVDMSMDTSMFERHSDHILEHLGMNYGLSLAQLKHQGVQSAQARQLMRVPLRELRLEQQVPLRRFERRFAEVQSLVLKRDLPELAFETTGWSIDFGEEQTPLSEGEDVALFDNKRRLGLTNTVDYIRERNPDLTEKQAMDALERNIDIEIIHQELLRPLMAISGALGADAPKDDDDPADAEDDETTPIQELAS